MQNPDCATQYSYDQFSVLAKARSMFHLSVLEVTYIKISIKPILCRQKEFDAELVTNGNVAPFVGARTTFEIHQSAFIIIHYAFSFSNINTTTFFPSFHSSVSS